MLNDRPNPHDKQYSRVYQFLRPVKTNEISHQTKELAARKPCGIAPRPNQTLTNRSVRPVATIPVNQANMQTIRKENPSSPISHLLVHLIIMLPERQAAARDGLAKHPSCHSRGPRMLVTSCGHWSGVLSPEIPQPRTRSAQRASLFQA